MKKTKWKSILVLILSSLVFSSCENKDEGPINADIDPNKLLSIHGIDFKLERGVIFQLDDNFSVSYKDVISIEKYIGAGNVVVEDTLKGVEAASEPVKTSAFTISLYEKGINHNYEIKKTLGRGAAISFRLFSDNYDQVKEGEYVYSRDRKVGKPIMIDFTGHACVNCRKMEQNVWVKPKVLDILKNDVVLISLYVDDRRKLKDDEIVDSKLRPGKKLKYIGEKWSELQTIKYKTNSQPYYVLMNHQEDNLSAPVAYTPDSEEYYNWLKKGITNF